MGRFRIDRWLGTLFSTNQQRRRSWRKRRSHHGDLSSQQLEQRTLLAAVVTPLTDGSTTAEDLVQSLVGDGVSFSNVTFTGDAEAAGLFIGGFSDDIGIDEGIILSSGEVANAPGPNEGSGTSTSFSLPGDADLDSISTQPTNDAAILEFDFVPEKDTISFTYILASDEYPEYANSSFNDVFGFFLDGENIAFLPGGTEIVSINNVNHVNNSVYYNDNRVGLVGEPTAFGTEYDGFTVPFSATASVIPGQVTRIKMAVADASDNALDTSVFIQAGSFVSKPLVSVHPVDPEAIEDPANDAHFAILRKGAVDEPLTVFFSDSGTAISGADYLPLPSSVTIPAGEASASVTLAPIDDTLVEEDEDVTLTLVSNNAYAIDVAQRTATATIHSEDIFPAVISFEMAEQSVTEDAGTFPVTLLRSGNLELTSHVIVSMAGIGTAEPDVDYSTSGFLDVITFAPGQTTAEFSVEILDDETDEFDEIFTLDLAPGSDGILDDPAVMEITILDNDPEPTVLVSDATGNEGDTVSFDVSLSNPSRQDITLTIGILGGTAVTPDDVVAPDTQLTIPAGSVSATATFDAQLVADTLGETDETFDVGVISVDAGAISGAVNGTGTIINAIHSLIIDDEDPGYSTNGRWLHVEGKGKGYQNDFEFVENGGPSDSATWTFDLEGPGEYMVSVSYRAWANRTTTAPYTVFDGAASLGTVAIDQTQLANDVQDNGRWFENLGTYSIFGNQLVVTLNGLEDGLVVADAVRVRFLNSLTDGPEILVESDGLSIADDTGVLDFGSISLGSVARKTIDVRNTGNHDLTLAEPISLPAGLSLISSFGGQTLAPGEATSFEVQAHSDVLGPLNGQISFGNNDANESPFNFNVAGTVVSTAIIDDGDAGFTTVGKWSPFVGPRKGYQDDFRLAVPGDGSRTSTWTFDVGPGQYLVSASWRAYANRATDAPFTISDGVQDLGTYLVDQQQPADSRVDGGVGFEDLATVNIFTNTLTVTLDNNADGFVIADAIRIDRLGDLLEEPEIDVAADGVNLSDGSGIFDFGGVSVGSAATQTFTVSNVGTTPLILGAINLPSGFFLATGLGATVLLPGESTTFDLQVDTSVVTSLAGEISFSTNDSNENPFNFMVQATVERFKVIADNSGPGFSTTGSWPTVHRNGFDGGFQFAVKGDGTSVARWAIDLPEAGLFRVSASYRAHSNRVTDARYSLLDGAVPLADVTVNQQVAANDIFDRGTWFEDLGTFTVAGTQLIVELSNLSLASDPDHFLIIADAIRVQRIGDLP